MVSEDEKSSSSDRKLEASPTPDVPGILVKEEKWYPSFRHYMEAKKRAASLRQGRVLTTSIYHNVDIVREEQSSKRLKPSSSSLGGVQASPELPSGNSGKKQLPVQKNAEVQQRLEKLVGEVLKENSGVRFGEEERRVLQKVSDASSKGHEQAASENQLVLQKVSDASSKGHEEAASENEPVLQKVSGVDHHQASSRDHEQASSKGKRCVEEDQPTLQKEAAADSKGIRSGGDHPAEASSSAAAELPSSTAAAAELPTSDPRNRIVACIFCGSKTRFEDLNNGKIDQPRYRCKTCKKRFTFGGKLRAHRVALCKFNTSQH